MDPHHSHYNAFALFQNGGRAAAEIFSEEPRSEPWATERETAILEHIKEDILATDPDAIIDVNCRTSSCRTRIISESPFLTSEFGGFPIGCWAEITFGDTEQIDNQGRTYADLFSLFGERNLRAEEYERHRDQHCADEQIKYREYIKKPYSR